MTEPISKTINPLYVEAVPSTERRLAHLTEGAVVATQRLVAEYQDQLRLLEEEIERHRRAHAHLESARDEAIARADEAERLLTERMARDAKVKVGDIFDVDVASGVDRCEVTHVDDEARTVEVAPLARCETPRRTVAMERLRRRRST